MHFDEYEASLRNLEKVLIPIVADKLLDNKLFDFQDLFASNSGGCGQGCSGCGGCH